MTETASGPTARKGRGSQRKGLRVQRIHTTAGVHPYDEIEWERRDVVMTNWRDGTVNFEQRGVEFPVAWTMNATQIVASKYFRGALGTPEREWSLKQLIDRVAGSYTRAGRDNGYFASDEDAEVFDHELKYALAHQLFSFNSPVWFNVGTQSAQQVSACQPYDALVSTPAGLVPIGELVESDAVGTKVYDAHGLTRVLATKMNGTKEVLRLHTKAGYTLDVTADHLVWKSTGPGVDAGGFVPAGSLEPGHTVQWHRRDAFGEDEITKQDIAEAALAGWLQSDGFVGQYEGTNRSLTIEAMTVNEAELDWVTRALDRVFPHVHRKESAVETRDTSLDCRRTRLYGKPLAEFVERWDLRERGTEMTLPKRLLTAPLPVVCAYLRSLFQAEGYVSHRERSTLVGLDMISEDVVRGVQRLLLRFGIFSRVRRKQDKRPNRHDTWSLGIQGLGERTTFFDEIGFLDERKSAKLEESLARPGRIAGNTKQLEISEVENLGPMPVYDIQTESGEYLSGNLRVHNCFILSVDDTMESILDWYKEEGIIFKGGSGAGVNLSRIRSSRELLSSGGTASGPVSFMRGADASAGTIKSGGATRRAAKMVVLDVAHPDVEEFIETKSREEHKIRALRDAGFDVDLGGSDMFSVQYQNANNSVRVSDAFMRAVDSGADFGLTSRTTGEVVATVDAKDLFHKMAKAAWECADPGVQYDDTINDWHTTPESGRISASNPCSEYVHLDNSSCNLASINLLKFLNDDNSFDVDRFVKLTELVITAMDISICFADFPTQKIGDTTRAFRQLGIGYANLGALLMATGHAYDSDGGRAVAGAITSLMTAVSYRRSAEMAGAVGPYDGYAQNEDAHKRVMRKHAAANDDLRTVGTMERPIYSAATKEWQNCLKVGEKNGWRNAQASLLAPTGTIGFMMDCDTTGIEPDFSLVKFKKLVGGGSMQIVNQAIPRALRNLGYQEEQVEAIVDYVSENGHVVDAPGLRTEHYEVFDCAMGRRYIEPMGHVRMMAAVQPFLSGAISKTVNVPEEATVADFEHIYFEGWRLGLKALAVYRDNCKVGQPLSTAKTETTEEPEPAVIEVNRPVRRRLPKKRPSETVSFSVGGAEGYITAGSYPDGGLGEVFMKLGKQGSTLAGVMDAFSIAVSIALQYGVPLETYVEKFTNMRFDPAGMTDDPDIRMAQSVVDYIFRRLALDHLSYEEREALGVLTAEERAAQVAGEDPAQVAAQVESYAQSAPVAEPNAIEQAQPAEESAQAAHSTAEVLERTQGRTADAPLCVTCGTKMRPSGSCYVCEGCGSTSGCS
ncbi:vitamin B12-dependent ribonucleotide reductase [Spiractinospora alimapuensis]|uniref:vitamin B12-dependent ribonucleotide reductase n=1 Tax=Spiractinospora alimapuensis TaxID=2820884 RepID=UPI001F27116A|nr:vitamin B12-dependent ribonucleotide reductase [Spiractinospora alimapuensis]QVQ51986.1 vitamin B12-dependent ribonucleotide reductase [Spiractinospora alimapuensis]